MLKSEVQNVERGSVLKSMHDVRKKLHARWSMPDARSLKVDRRCPMHGELPMLDGRCTIFESRSLMHTKLQLFHAINGKQKVSNNHHFEWAENIIVDGKGKDESMLKQSLKGKKKGFET